MRNQKSSILNDSQLSMFLQPQKSETQLKCQQLLKQCSQYRTTIRQLKQQNQWLKTTNQGQRDQCDTLKQILLQKKQMIINLNCDLRMANQQLNRLQDIIGQKQNRVKELQTNLFNIIKQIQLKNQSLLKYQQQLQDNKFKLEHVLKQKQNIKSDTQVKQKLYLVSAQQKLIKTIEKYDKYYLKQITQLKGNLKYQQILNQLIERIQKLVEEELSLKTQLKQKIIQFQLQKQNNLKRINNLQIQLKQASELVQQSQKLQIQKQLASQKLEQKLRNMQKSTTRHKQSMIQSYQLSISKLLDVFAPLLKQEQHILNKIGQSIKSSQNQYQIDVVLEQIRPTIAAYMQEKSFKQKYGRQLKEWENKLKYSQQQFDTLKLKHITLQRQYEAVMQDNRRILKFNHLSRYRTQRNSITKSTNKQNSSSYSNPNTNIKQMSNFIK